MAILQILQYPDLRLRRKGHKVTDVKSPKIQKTINDMFDTLGATKDCAALAATQLDIDNPPNITVINSTDEDEEALCLINPQITAHKGQELKKEGCMSICPEKITAEVKRATTIKVKALDKNGNHLAFEANDYFARCIQHECDHLKGILYIDHLTKAERSSLEKEIAEAIVTQ